MYWHGHQHHTLALIRRFPADTPEGRAIKRIRRQRGRATAGWESLTEAELDVIRLLAQGITNRKIAGRLHVSPRTVQTHLAHVFRKLDADTRAAVAADAARRLA